MNPKRKNSKRQLREKHQKTVSPLPPHHSDNQQSKNEIHGRLTAYRAVITFGTSWITSQFSHHLQLQRRGFFQQIAWKRLKMLANR